MEALLSQFTFLSDQALQGNKNFDPSAIEDLMKLFEIESYKAWAALELEEEKQVKRAEITMQQAEDYFDSVMETAVDKFMGLKDDLLHGIYNYGFEKPSAIQQRAVMPIINGRDVISQAQSGDSRKKWNARQKLNSVGWRRPRRAERLGGCELRMRSSVRDDGRNRADIEFRSDRGLKDDLLHGIYNYGFEKPLAIQQRAVMPIINGRDVISQAQSGTRKTSMIALTICQVVDTASKEYATRETGALQAAKNKLEKQVEELTWRLQLEKRMRVDLEEAKTQENAKLQSALQDIQLQFKETKELLAKEREAAKKAVEVVPIIQEVLVVDPVMLEKLTNENEKLKSEECLRKERQRVSHYLHSSSETKLLEVSEMAGIVQHELLVTYANRLLEKEHSGCRALLRDDKVEDLSRMYRLYCKIPRGLEPVANVFKQHVTAEGTALVQQAEDADSHPVLIANIRSQYKYTPTYYKVWVVKQKDMDKLHHGWDD
ncbi:hypothetical protein GOBAR_AA28081 [Gossypium barbadense]|uniref:Cullin N-terminal domain-containing protein n=1 Tax=Gossypium barbadense TaxID=3634 RepID=A0A2P5WND1_GOSBA|nr:hypothetical protein GOBAR_AA28081 [Gossypium barbadense]